MFPTGKEVKSSAIAQPEDGHETIWRLSKNSRACCENNSLQLSKYIHKWSRREMKTSFSFERCWGDVVYGLSRRVRLSTPHIYSNSRLYQCNEEALSF